jgi:CRISPR-associated protein (TIGR03986 family)
MATGKLIVNKKNKLQLSFTNRKGKTVNGQVKEAELSQPLLEQKHQQVAALHEMEVEFEEVQGQPTQIRKKGEAWEEPRSQQSNAGQSRSRPNATEGEPNPATASKEEGPQPGDFHNPYNFIPAQPRNTDHSELGDREPAGHGSYRKDHWSGRIAVQVRTVTPLLIPDASREQEDCNQHKIQPIREGPEGTPILPPTSIKGMLRAAYESITNSRLGVWQGHQDRLAYRMPAGSTVFPARVERQNDTLFLRVMKKAAKLPRYGKDKNLQSNETDKGENRKARKYKGSSKLPQHREPVWVRLNKKQIVTAISPNQGNGAPNGNGWQKGWVCVTGPNIQGKTNERVFIESQNDKQHKVDGEIRDLWEELVRNYQQTHKQELEQRRRAGYSPQAYRGSEPGRTGWSRHVWDTKELTLDEGTLCYVAFSNNGNIKSVQPVTISRRLYDCPPEKLLDDSLKPAGSLKELSPAERAFGWVNPKGHGSYKGNVRVNHVVCQSDNAIERFGNWGLPLQILGPPKPQQTRFYTAENKNGDSLQCNSSKERGYTSHNFGLRGRKVYPHHRGLPEGHWSDPLEATTQQPSNGHYPEYRRPPKENNEQRDSQNRSTQGWVKPGVTFTCNVDFTNLSPVELGALLWLLDLPQNHYHRLGGGKPLGFGSVRIEIDWENTDLRTGQDWETFYRTLQPQAASNSPSPEDSIKSFKTAAAEAYNHNQSPEEIGFIAAFMRASKGFDDELPVHYPRTQEAPNPDGESFKWFVKNEEEKRSLPALVNDCGLPMLGHPE